jgi:multidrug efflux system membrane fusion protein
MSLPTLRRLGAACLALLLAGCIGTSNGAAALPGASAVPVAVAPALRKSVPLALRAVGIVEAAASVAVKSRVDGEIVAVAFKDGAEVARGDLLFRIDPRPYQAQLAQTVATVARDEAQLANARSQEQRSQELLAQKFVSKEAYTVARTNRDAAAATVAADRAAVDSARLQLAYTTIHAPIGGRAGKIQITAGNLVKANDTAPLVVINQVSPIDVAFAVPEGFGQAIRTRAARGPLRVEVEPRSPGAKPVEGRLAFVDNAADSTTGTIKVRAELANADRALWPGDFVSAVLYLREDRDATVVPSAAIQDGPDGPYVYVVQPDLNVALREVRVDRSAGAETLIAGGLAPGERVVVDGASRLVPGARVRIAGGRTAS